MSHSKNFLYKNTNISFTEKGTGKTVVFLHGFLENKFMWDAFIPEISKKNRIICIDLLGHGDSECIGYVHTMETQAEMVWALLNELKITKATFIGHSMGGYVALAFAELYPDFITNLVLLNSTSYEDNLERKGNRDRAIKAVKQNYVVAVSMSIANLFSEKNRNVLLDEIAKTKKEALKTPLQGIIAAQEGMKIRKERLFVLQNATFPITLILGKQDAVMQYLETAKQVENTSVKLISLAGGHMSYIENRDEFMLFLKEAFN